MAYIHQSFKLIGFCLIKYTLVSKHYTIYVFTAFCVKIIDFTQIVLSADYFREYKGNILYVIVHIYYTYYFNHYLIK